MDTEGLALAALVLLIYSAAVFSGRVSLEVFGGDHVGKRDAFRNVYDNFIILVALVIIVISRYFNFLKDLEFLCFFGLGIFGLGWVIFIRKKPNLDQNPKNNDDPKPES